MEANINYHTPTRPISQRPINNDVFPSPPFSDQLMYPWNWGESSQIYLSPASSCGSPRSLLTPDSPTSKDTLPRGRPRTAVINDLMVEGLKTESTIRCPICKRVFPREKSLQAHLRIHTGNVIL